MKKNNGIYSTNSLDAFVPEIWANEAVAILEENMVAASVCYRDFSKALASFGDVVNTRKPGAFTATRMAVGDSLTLSNATSTNIPVRLDQHLSIAFDIKDREQAYSFQELSEIYLQPALLGIAQFIDKMVLFQAPQFLRSDKNYAGSLGTNASVASILDNRKNLNIKKAYVNNRNMFLSPKDESALLALEIFISAEKVGDQGTALREASLGKRLGFNHFMCQNVISVTGTSDTVTGAVNDAAGGVSGATALTVDGLSAAIAVGTWFTVAGDMTPQRITGTTGGATPTALAFSPGLKTAVVDNAVVTFYDPGAVNLTAGYAAGWEKAIVVDAFTNAPQVGQFVQFVANGPIYTVMIGTTTSITLDRPLEAAIADNAVVFIGPNGTYNFAFHPNAIALVMRPMALPAAGTGTTGAIAIYKNLAVRILRSYSHIDLKHIISVDVLCGIKVLDTDLGELMLG